MSRRRLVILFLTIAVAITLFLTIDIPALVTFFQEGYESYPIRTVLIFIGVYITVTLFGLPGAALLSISAGLIFGLVQGILYASIAAGISAVLSFLLGRYLLRDYITRRFTTVVSRINNGIENEGRFYLFFLRLVPGIPFPVLNMSFGLTTMSLFTFWWITQIGMLPITSLLVNAGKGMEDLSSLSGIFTVKSVSSLVAVGILPVIIKLIHSHIISLRAVE